MKKMYALASSSHPFGARPTGNCTRSIINCSFFVSKVLKMRVESCCGAISLKGGSTLIGVIYLLFGGAIGAGIGYFFWNPLFTMAITDKKYSTVKLLDMTKDFSDIINSTGIADIDPFYEMTVNMSLFWNKTNDIATLEMLFYMETANMGGHGLSVLGALCLIAGAQMSSGGLLLGFMGLATLGMVAAVGANAYIFFIYSNCFVLWCGVFLGLFGLGMLFHTYFVVVVNSFRKSLQEVDAEEEDEDDEDPQKKVRAEDYVEQQKMAEAGRMPPGHGGMPPPQSQFAQPMHPMTAVHA